MIFDKENLFSDQQAVTETANSTNVVDLGVKDRDIGRGTPIHLLVQVTEDFATLTSLDIIVQTSDAEAFGSSTDVVTVSAVPVADLVAGYQLPIQYVPRGVDGRYVRLRYVVNGSNATAGKITAGTTLGIQAGFAA